METLETSKTLDEVSVRSRDAEDPCGKTLEGASGISSFSEKCTMLEPSGDPSMENDCTVDDNSKDICNAEAENQFLDAGRCLEDAKVASLVCNAAGILGNRNNFLGFGGTEMLSLVDEPVAEENLKQGASLEADFEGKRLPVQNRSKVKFENALVQEMCVDGSGSEETGIEKVVNQEGVEEGHALHLNRVDSGNKVEASRDGISLFVEVFGPVDGLVKGDGSNCLAEQGRDFDQLNLCKGGDALSLSNGDKGGIPEIHDYPTDGKAEGGNEVEGDATGNQEYRFNVGDFVWVKTKTQPWWPGIVCDPSDVSKDTEKTNQRNCLLVRCFGTGNLVWSEPSQLKPFLDYFEQMSRQGNSKSFLSAVEKAVGGIGRCVKFEMTCSCFPKEGKNVLAAMLVAKEGGEILEQKTSKLGEFPVTVFEPSELVSRIKYLAQNVSAHPGMIEFTVMQNRLSAFYRSIGHHQLPMHQLKPTTDAKSHTRDGFTSGDNISSHPALMSRNRGSNKDLKDGSDEVISSEMQLTSLIISSKSTENKASCVENGDMETDGKSEKGYESRERRKSKYLSFPYVDLSRGSKSLSDLEKSETKDPMESSNIQSKGSTPTGKFSGKSQKKGSKKPIANKPEKINASSAEMLSVLRFTALDCLYPDLNRNFDLIDRFFSGFRKFGFRDFTHEIANEDTVQREFDHEMPLLNTLPEVEIQMEKRIKEGGIVEYQRTELLVSSPDVTRNVEIDSVKKDPNTKPKKKRRKAKEKSEPLGSNTKLTAGVSQTTEDITRSDPVVKGFTKKDPLASEGKSVVKKRKRRARRTQGVPEIKVMAGLPDLNGKSTGFQVEGWNTRSIAPQKATTPAKCSNAKGGVALPNAYGSSGKVGAVLKDIEVVSLYSLQNTPELNSEGIKEAALLHLGSGLAANPPYDNGNNTEPSSIMKDTEQIGFPSNCGEPERKKRERKQKAPDCQTKGTSAIPDLNGNAAESSFQGKELPETNCIPPEGKPRRKRRRKKAATGLFDIQTNGGGLETALLLKFAPEFPVPSKEELVSTFSVFGLLNESKTQVLSGSASAQVVFSSSSDARSAFRSLEKSSPFGPALVNYRLHHLLAASGVLEPDGSLNMHQAWPDKVKRHAKPRTSKKPKIPGKPSGLKPQSSEAPDLLFVRQNLEMMTSMLENAGDNLTPDMRAKLENEIKSLLKKVSTMVGSSST